jgi:hypothetical protein
MADRLTSSEWIGLYALASGVDGENVMECGRVGKRVTGDG